MADYTIGLDEVAVHAKTLQPNVVDTVTFTRNVDNITIISDGAADLYYTMDGTMPVVAGPRTYRLPGGFGGFDERPAPLGIDAIKLVSTGSPTYSVQA